jgi:hypothetical protein
MDETPPQAFRGACAMEHRQGSFGATAKQQIE